MTIDQQTLKDLEFTTIRDLLQEYAIGYTAKQRLIELSPIKGRKKIKIALQQVNELKNIRTEAEVFPHLDFEELKSELKLLPIKNASIQLEGFMRILYASQVVNRLIYFFDKREDDYPLLSKVLENSYFTVEIAKAIEVVFDKHGNVKDNASAELFEIRTSLKSVKKKINRNFDKEARKLIKNNILGDTKETFINDRRVLTVLSNHKRKISGSVVGSSNTGSLTYIEPEVNIALNNEFELLQDDERKEIFKILQVLKEYLLNHIELIKEYQTVLSEFDFINAKTKLALSLNCNLPSIVDDLEMELFDAYHPILWKTNKNQKKNTKPQHIKINKFSRMLVISGPNAGGKSITLKSVGLLQVMLQSGLLVSVGANSKMCLFENVLSDIGDNQSITNELSTYSYRLKRMNEFLKIANKHTLLLLDEFGTGSDPDLGGALAEVIFETLYNKKSYAVITTHYNNIKLKADQLRNAVNGSMLFNTETLEPTYKFSIGQPGSSFTFEVAKINGIPYELIEEAKNKLDDKKVRMDKLLNQLQKEKTYLSKLNKEHVEAQNLAQNALNEYKEKRDFYDVKLKKFRINAESNQRFIQAGKKLITFIEKYNTTTRKKVINNDLLEEVRKYLAVEKSKTEGVKQREKQQQLTKERKSKGKSNAKRVPDIHQKEKIIVGSRVKLITTKQIGNVEEIKGETAVVSFGFARMKVDKSKLSFVD